MFRNPHFYYIVGILLFIIIILLTTNFAENYELVSYLTFSLTISSILLALITIIYSITSNNNLFANISDLTRFSNEINSISEELKDTVSLLNKKIETIPVELSNFENKISSGQKALTEGINRLSEQANTKPLKEFVSSVGSEKDAKDSLNLPIETIEFFIANCSMSGLMCIYGYKIAYEKKIEVNLKNYSELLFASLDYIFGFTIGVYSLKLIHGVFKTDKDRPLLITYYNQRLSEIIKQKVYDKAKEFDGKSGSAYADGLKKIEQFFG